MVANANRMEAKNKAIQEGNAPFNAIQSIKVHFHQGAGSNERIIAKMGKCLISGNPFGLRLGSDKFIAFIPQRLTAYLFGHSADKQVFNTAQAMADTVALSYLTHKEFVSTKKLLKTLEIFKKKARINEPVIRQNILPESGEPAGPVGSGAEGV